MKSLLNVVKNIPIDLVNDSLTIERHIADFVEVMEDRRLNDNYHTHGYHVEWVMSGNRRFSLKGEITGWLITSIFYSVDPITYMKGIRAVYEEPIGFTTLPIRNKVQLIYEILYLEEYGYNQRFTV